MKERLYLPKEISRATGLTVATIHGRRKKLGIPASGMGYTLDQVKAILKAKPRMRKASEARSAALRSQLLNDGAL